MKHYVKVIQEYNMSRMACVEVESNLNYEDTLQAIRDGKITIDIPEYDSKRWSDDYDLVMETYEKI